MVIDGLIGQSTDTRPRKVRLDQRCATEQRPDLSAIVTVGSTAFGSTRLSAMCRVVRPLAMAVRTKSSP